MVVAEAVARRTIVGDALLDHLFGDAERRRVEDLVPLHVRQGDHQRAAGELRGADGRGTSEKCAELRAKLRAEVRPFAS